MRAETFVPLEDRLRATLFAWLDGYVARPHPELGRDGDVCPFVRSAVDAGNVVALAARLPGRTAGDVVRMTERAIEEFRTTEWRTRNATTHSLIVVIEGLSRDEWRLVDEGHRLAKGAAVAQGLMLGQFHPECDAPAARNPLFPVNRCPLPLMVIRNMAFHDILFLHQDPVWFAHYHARFGRYYESGARLDPHFADLFRRARARHGLDGRAVSP